MNDKKRTIANSVILGLFLCGSMITKIITSIVSFNNNLVLFIGALLVLSFVLNLQRRFTLKLILINMIVALAFVISVFMNIRNSSYTTNYLLNYLLYGVAGMLLCSVKTDDSIVIKAMTAVYMAFTVLTVMVYIPQAQNEAYIEQSMDISYTIVIGLSASVFAWKGSNKILRVLILAVDAISLYYLMFLSDCRGAVLTLVFMGGIILLKRSKHKAWLSLLFIFLIVFVVWGWDFIIDALLESNSEMRWISRFRRGTDIFSGRSDLLEQAKNLISSNVFGNGIGRFEVESGGQYTHNMYVQLFCEFGVFWGSIVSVYVTVLVIKTLFDKRSSGFDIFCICQFIPRLLLSSVYWSNPFIWIFLYTKSGRQTARIIDRQKGAD